MIKRKLKPLVHSSMVMRKNNRTLSVLTKTFFMSQTITQEVLFRNTTARALYDLYMDSTKHSVATGAPANISPSEGGSYSAHSGYITGRNLQLIRDRLIVQSWRAQSWNNDDVDSTFII